MSRWYFRGFARALPLLFAIQVPARPEEFW